MPKATVVTFSPENVSSIEKMPQPARRTRNMMWIPSLKFIKKTISDLLHSELMRFSLMSFLLSRVLILEQLAPFGLAFYVAYLRAGHTKTFLVGLCAVFGVITAGHFREALIYGLTIAMLSHSVKLIPNSMDRNRFLPLAAAAIMAAGGLVIHIILSDQLFNILMIFFDASFALVTSYIFAYVMPVFANKGQNKIGFENLLSFIILAAVALAGIGALKIWGCNVRNVIASAIVLTVALSTGAGLSSAVGTVLGLAISLTDGGPLPIVCYALAGLFAGIFKSLGRAFAFSGFILGELISNLCFSPFERLSTVFFETCAAAALAYGLSITKFPAWVNTINGEDKSRTADKTTQTVVDKLTSIAAIFSELALNFEQHCRSNGTALNEDKLAQMLRIIGTEACEKCANRPQCWEKDFYVTYQSIMDILVLSENSEISVKNLPEYLRLKCIKKDIIVSAINCAAERNRELAVWSKKLNETRQLVTDQMKAFATVFSGLKDEVEAEPYIDEDLVRNLKAKAQVLGCKIEEIKLGERGSVKSLDIRKQPCNGTRECINTMTPIVSNILKEKVTLHTECGCPVRPKKCRLLFETVQRFQLETGMACAAKEPQGISGDTCTVVPLGRSKVALILSDGMGSGNSAANESAATVTLLKRLLEAGFDVRRAVKTVNALLLLSRPNEVFSTLDMVIVDTYSGEAEFLKIGASPSYVKRVREVAVIQHSTPPIGIINHIQIEPVKCTTVPGDIIVMVSDGVFEASLGNNERENWLVNFLRRIDTDNPQKIAASIINQAERLTIGRERDDMTVLVARLTERL